MVIKNFFKQTYTFYFIPFVTILVFWLISSINFNLHDFSNSYFSAKLIGEGISSDKLFDIYEFNNYIWDLGYEEVLVDFYLNSPFTITAFYPLTFIENAYTAKLVFNIFSIVLFLLSIFFLIKYKFKEKYWILLILPFIFFIPIRNQILFGQTYFLIFSLIIFSFILIEKKKEMIGSTLLSFAIILKIFPIFYGITLLFNKNWKSMVIGLLSSVFILLLSIYFSGYEIWENYILNILPNSIANNSTVGFRSMLNL